MTGAVDPTIDWLLSSDEPAIRAMTRRDLLGEPATDDLAKILEGPRIRGLLDGQQPDGGFGGPPYRKWTGAHWRLVSLVELEVPPGEPRAVAALERELRWLTGSAHRATVVRVEKLPRRDASMEGNALAVTCRLGLADDPRARLLAGWLVAWQWPDGGWNCDGTASGRRSSFHESLCTMWGLLEYAAATGDSAASAAAGRAADLFLDHRLFRRHGTGEPIHPSWVVLHYPAYWHYDAFQALHVLRQMGLAADSRAGDGLDLLERRRSPDGTWRAGGYWWSPPGSGRPTPEVVDWWRGQPNPMLTLNALRILKSAGRWQAGSAT